MYIYISCICTYFETCAFSQKKVKATETGMFQNVEFTNVSGIGGLSQMLGRGQPCVSERSLRNG